MLCATHNLTTINRTTRNKLNKIKMKISRTKRDGLTHLQCSRCKTTLPVEDFPIRVRMKPDGTKEESYQSWCKYCRIDLSHDTYHNITRDKEAKCDNRKCKTCVNYSLIRHKCKIQVCDYDEFIDIAMPVSF